MPTAVETSKVTGRRQLRFDSLDDLLAEVDRLGSAKEIRTLGNWSAGQNLQHLAVVMNKSIDGFASRPHAVIRFVARWFLKRRILTTSMSAGHQLPARAESELVPPACSLQDGLSHIRQAIARLKADATRVPNLVLGPLSQGEWTQFHCRHAELHLSFLVPVD